MPRLLYVALVLAVLSAAPAVAQPDAAAQFDRLRALAGDWTGTGPDGLQLSVSYTLVSGGNAIMETRRPAGEPDMVTLFYLDGNALMLTHFCSAGNQPRMRAVDTEDRDMRFEFVDVTNLSTRDEGHMRGLAYTFERPDRLTQTWIWRQDGIDRPAAFTLTRAD